MPATADMNPTISPEAEARLAAEFPPGTLVSLKSGGPAMTVSKVHEGRVMVVFWAAADGYLGIGRSGAQQLDGRSFHPAMLVKREA